MFAGPNGSGKSTIKSVISPVLLGIYINPDEIEAEIRCCGFVNLSIYGIESSLEEIRAFFRNSGLIQKAGLQYCEMAIRFSDGNLSFLDVAINAYFTSVIADFLRQKLLKKRISFTFETVMSSPDKMLMMEKAQSMGYRTYLYYVATEDPIINVSRVKNRVKKGGHSVPEDKIISRYGRSLDLLAETIRHTNRAYIFDNSNLEHIWLAEITDGKSLEMKTDMIPAWFKYAVLDKMTCNQ